MHEGDEEDAGGNADTATVYSANAAGSDAGTAMDDSATVLSAMDDLADIDNDTVWSAMDFDDDDDDDDDDNEFTEQAYEHAERLRILSIGPLGYGWPVDMEFAMAWRRYRNMLAAAEKAFPEEGDGAAAPDDAAAGARAEAGDGAGATQAERAAKRHRAS